MSPLVEVYDSGKLALGSVVTMAPPCVQLKICRADAEHNVTLYSFTIQS